MLRRLGNVLTVLGSLSGLLAGYLWWRAATASEQVSFAYFSRDAALVTGTSAMLIAVAEAIRLVRRHRSDLRDTLYYPAHVSKGPAHSLPANGDGSQISPNPAAAGRANRRGRGRRKSRDDGNDDQEQKPAEDETVR